MTTCRSCGHDSAEGFRFCPACGARVEEEQGGGDPLLGRTLNGKYRVIEEIGAGAMGRVYLGEHVGLRKRVALKVLHADLKVGEETLKRFRQEGVAAGKFNHPNAIQIFDLDEDQGGVVYLAMEYVEGVNLKAFLRQKGRLTVPLAVDVIRQVLSALGEAHQHGIVHRDLKPENIMVVPGSTGELRVKVLDFGLSKLVDQELRSSLQTQVGRLLGTPLYMAPEQVAGEEADAQSDLYAVGLILYELVAGITPFPDESTTEILFTRASREAPSLADSHPDLSVPAGLERVIACALERRRGDRYSSAGEMLAQLDELDPRAIAQPRKRPAADRTTVDAPTPARRRSLAVPLSIVLAVVAVAVLATVFAPGLRSLTASPPLRVRDVPVEQRDERQSRYVELLDEARSALRRRDPAASLAACDEAIHMEDMLDAEAYLVRAATYRARRDELAARLDYEDALGLEPGCVEALTGLGWLHLDAGEPARAATAFEAALESEPGSAEALAGRAAVLLSEGDRAAARTALDQALEQDERSAPALLQQGLLLLQEGALDEAVEALTNAARGDWRTWEAKAALGDAELARGRADEAALRWAEALDEEPEALPVREKLVALHVSRERFDQAVTIAREALRERPDAASLRVLAGVALLGAGRRAEGIAELERAVRDGAPDTEACILIGADHLAAGRLPEAAAALDAAIERDADSAVAHLDRGLVAFLAEDAETAQRHLERALELDADLGYAHYALGILELEWNGDGASARRHLERYRELGGERREVELLLRRSGR